MKRISIVTLAVALFIWSLVLQDACAADKPVFILASAGEGRDILTAKDDFIEQLSPFDRSARMKTGKTVSTDEFLSFVAQNVLSWEAEEKDRLQSVIATLEPKLQQFAPFLPDRIYLIKTTGNEEGGVAYTRGNAIIFPERQVMGDVVSLYKLISHELFHIILRNNKEMRSDLYGVIGFKKCPPFDIPGALLPRKITNPDTPMNQFCISINADKQKLLAVPILYSSTETYEKERGGSFFDYLQVAFLAVAKDNGPGRKPTPLKSDQAKLYSEEELGGFYEQIGRNTDYTIHPEEILADNFSLLFFGITELQSPEIIEKMKKVFNKAGKRGQGTGIIKK